MVRLDLSYFYRLGLGLSELNNLPEGSTIGDIWLTLYGARDHIRSLFADAALKTCLRSSYASGNALYMLLDELGSKGFEETLGNYEIGSIRTAFERFEAVLTSELAVADAYFVLEKGGFSTVKLIAEGECIFPSALPTLVPDAVTDLREAAKCLAFELPTAAGFHTLRATEAVLRKYWEVVAGGEPKPKQRNIGVYLAAMKKLGCGDPKVIAALQQLKDLHRNVIFHPDESLDVEGAISLLGIARSVVGAMLAEMPKPELVLTSPEGEA